MNRDITYGDSMKIEGAIYVDVRSPKEFMEDHIPGAVNLPILDDDQRKIVGTLYKQQGKEEASKKGVELVLPVLGGKLEQLRQLENQGTLVLYCWRGGLRSKSMSDLAAAAGIEVKRIKGGYKEYRKYVMQEFEQLKLPPFYSLYGLTGTGKTEIIEILEKRGVYTLNLEKYANHRGSVFGSVGLGEQPSQKHFDSVLLRELQQIPVDAPTIIEGESSRIGKLFIAKNVFTHLLNSNKILVYDSVENRAKRIIKEYTKIQSNEELIQAVSFLGRRIGKQKVNQFVEAIEKEEYQQVVEELLIKYYDPLYNHPSKPSDEYFASVCSADVEKAADSIQQLLHKGE
ncbi:tRNA 2-selenouridine(34) synthase MnmH [Clostridia bacterium]|nr:tRNA 2-selenouridine(34) synthase MnmH [Clostridia bacterium]